MVEFVPGKTVRSRQPRVLVENRLDPGVYRFRLTVVGANGVESDPADLVVTVRGRRPLRPDPILRPDVITRPIPIFRPGRPIR